MHSELCCNHSSLTLVFSPYKSSLVSQNLLSQLFQLANKEHYIIFIEIKYLQTFYVSKSKREQVDLADVPPDIYFLRMTAGGTAVRQLDERHRKTVYPSLFFSASPRLSPFSFPLSAVSFFFSPPHNVMTLSSL